MLDLSSPSSSSSPASSSSSSPPLPLLTWKGIQSWSVGHRAPTLCKIFMQSNTSPISGIRKILTKKKKSPPRTSNSTTPGVPAAASSSSPSPSSSINLAAMPASSSSPFPSVFRRHSDAGPRLSTSSYERVSVDYHSADLGLPRMLKLGAGATEPHFHRQESSISGFSRVDSAVTPSRFMSSPAVLSSKLKGTYSRIINAAHQNNPHISELFTGNPLLLHVTAAPVPGVGVNADVRPSGGLVDASLKCRESELKDRIILFL